MSVMLGARNKGRVEADLKFRHLCPPQAAELGPRGYLDALHAVQQDVEVEAHEVVADDDVGVCLVQLGDEEVEQCSLVGMNRFLCVRVLLVALLELWVRREGSCESAVRSTQHLSHGDAGRR